MIDHILGRPSVKSRRLQVLAVLFFWSFYLLKGSRNGPPLIRRLSRSLSRKLTVWQTVLITMMYLYTARHFSILVGLASPDPLANMYDATYFRATWILTALDAGFWTAMKIRRKWLRDIASMVFTVFYMVSAEQADEKVRKVRANVTVDHLRVSWNKGTSRYLGLVQNLTRPRFTKWPPRQIRIPRPPNSDYKEPVNAWLYFDGSLAQLKEQTRMVLDVPGGGFVAMDPRCCDDRLLAWASKTGLPILSLDYRKAPEYPYPYALNECYDVYTSIIRTKGTCLGMSGARLPQIVVTGDSAGGSLATAMTIMVIESGSSALSRFSNHIELPTPEGMVLSYPGLDMNIGNWMSDAQMSLMKDRRTRHQNKAIIRRKSMQYNKLAGTPHHSDDEDETPPDRRTASQRRTDSDDMPEDRDDDVPSGSRTPQPEYARTAPTTFSRTSAASRPTSPTLTNQASSSSQTLTAPQSHHPQPLRTRLATSSMISYFNDRVLTPEMMRAMIILYIGPHNRPDFSSDYLLSPILCPDLVLSKFPKMHFLTGERDPLVDDTVIFAGRLKRVKAAMWASGGKRTEYVEEDMLDAGKMDGFDDKDVAEVALLPGVSHGFLNFTAIYPPAWKYIDKTAGWIEDIFRDGEKRKKTQARERGRARDMRMSRVERSEENEVPRHHNRVESSGDEGQVLEMGMTRLRARTLTNEKRTQDSDESVQDKDAQSAEPPEEQTGRANGKTNGKLMRKKESMVRLASSDDILGRRMQGLAGPLTGLTED